MKQLTTSIITNECIAENYYALTFPWPEEPPLPGQFFSLRIGKQTDPLLRRPFAFAGYDPVLQTAAMIYQVRGKATDLLCAMRGGAPLDIAGPFGNAFTPTDKLHLLTAGGIGLGPMLFFANQLRAQALPFRFIYGCRKQALIPETTAFTSLAPVLCTDDGSAGFHGTTVTWLHTLPEATLRSAALYGCGPLPMLKGCHALAQQHNIECYVSMEEMMACSVGACMGCVIMLKEGYARVCKEGAIFKSRDIIWD